MDNFYTILGKRIKNERKLLKLTQEELSEKCGISPEYLRLIESRKRRVSLPKLRVLAEIFNVSPSDLLIGLV